eukprot:6200146-Pleurochrysis_carterae.AAC.2
MAQPRQRSLNTRALARRGLRVPPELRGRAGTAGGGRSIGPRRLVRACVGCARVVGERRRMIPERFHISKSIPGNQTNMLTLTLTRRMHM